VLCLLGAFFVWAGVMYIKNQRRLASVPLHTVASAPNSQAVRIIGVAMPFQHLPLLIAPFSQTPCLAYEVEVKYGVPRERKVVTDQRWQVMPFMLVDDTGTAELVTSPTVPFLRGGRATLDQGFFSLGASSDQYPAVRMFGRDKVDQVIERVLLPSDRVMVYACAMRNAVPSGGGDYRTGSREQVSLVRPAPKDIWLVQVEGPRP